MGALRRLYGIDEGWERPVVPRSALPADLLLTAALVLGSLLSIETTHSLGALDDHLLGGPGTYLWIALPVATIALRRVLPLTVLGIAIAHYVVTAIALPEISPVFALQVYYFFTLFSAVAWSAHRRAALAMSGVMAVAAAFWIVSELLLHDALDQIRLLPTLGLFDPTTAALLQAGLSSLTFFLAASLGGVASWWSARREARAGEQAVTIAAQADRLRQRSVVDERLRIARELHDVIGHHVSLIGIQTAAARAVLRSSPDDAASALQTVEEISRGATRDLRLLLSALRVQRSADDEAVGSGDLTGLPDLLATYDAFGLRADLSLEGDVRRAPAALALAAYRVVQEALTNVTRHSEASTADVLLCVEQEGTGGELRLEVRDPGPARASSTSGTRMGLVGMQERVDLHDGELTAASTEEGGFVVAARLVWADTATSA
ncbi:MAG TPA: histidine kinase [Nocardioides sp.]